MAGCWQGGALVDILSPQPTQPTSHSSTQQQQGLFAHHHARQQLLPVTFTAAHEIASIYTACTSCTIMMVNHDVATDPTSPPGTTRPSIQRAAAADDRHCPQQRTLPSRLPVLRQRHASTGASSNVVAAYMTRPFLSDPLLCRQLLGHATPPAAPFCGTHMGYMGGRGVEKGATTSGASLQPAPTSRSTRLALESHMGVLLTPHAAGIQPEPLASQERAHLRPMAP